MKKFETPELLVERFEVEDVITASSGQEPVTYDLENTTRTF